MMDHPITVGDVLVVWGAVVLIIVVALAVMMFGYSQFWWGRK